MTKLRDMCAKTSNVELRRLFDVYTSPQGQELANFLSTIEKGGHQDWLLFLNDVMTAMDLHDAGVFPDEWFEDEE